MSNFFDYMIKNNAMSAGENTSGRVYLSVGLVLKAFSIIMRIQPNSFGIRKDDSVYLSSVYSTSMTWRLEGVSVSMRRI